MYDQENYKVDLTQEKPADNMTNERWQNCFKIIKEKVTPSRFRCMPYPRGTTLTSEYCGDTIYQTYCKFINGILRTIRTGEQDYCFYIYQIADLLKYEPRLLSKWLEEEQCFQVWLQR